MGSAPVRGGGDRLTERVYHRGPARYSRAMTAIRRWLATGALVSAGFLGGALLTGRLQSREAEDAAQRSPAPAAAAAAAQPAGAVAATGGPDFTQIAARTSASVVNISAVQVYRQRRFVDPFSNLFGGEDAFPVQRGQSAGSGVIVGSDGYVLTNNHVLGRARCSRSRSFSRPPRTPGQARRHRPDHRSGAAQDRGAQPADRDLGRLGAAQGRRVGARHRQPVSARTDRHARHRQRPDRSYEDVSVDRGLHPDRRRHQPGQLRRRAGQPRGELVGINTWIYSQSGGDQGIGFAIPSNIARRVTEEIISTGEVKRGTIGEMQLASMTPALARDLSLTDTQGALVWNMYRRRRPTARGSARLT